MEKKKENSFIEEAYTISDKKGARYGKPNFHK
jgi:hypothetical protein